MFIQAYLHICIELLGTYKGPQPFSTFSKKYFSLHKKYGSKDRKHIAHICYCYFRLGKSLPGISTINRLAIGLFLCNDYMHPVLAHIRPQWEGEVKSSLPVKVSIVSKEFSFSINDIFSMEGSVSSMIHFEQLCTSILEQPYTYLRIRPGKEKKVRQKLGEAKILCQLSGNASIQLFPGIKIDEVLKLNEEVVVQDKSSQQVLDSLLTNNTGIFETAWDCCAASGGKSILLKDLFPGVHLTVSDIRGSILANLKKRFAEAGIKVYNSFIADLSASSFSIDRRFDLIICDAPCTGSGTWGRTPEQLSSFDEKKIEHYSLLQKKILSNCIKGLNTKGVLLYITCSVFREENENIVTYAQDRLSLKLIDQSYIIGYDQRADTLFTALFSL